MPIDQRPEIGTTVAIQKVSLDLVFSNLKKNGFELVGPTVRQDTLVYAPIDSMADLPRGYLSEQQAGQFKLAYTDHPHYFDVIPGADSWKQYLFPSRTELFSLIKNGGLWETRSAQVPEHSYAFIGVRPCELAAIQIQDGVFLRPDFVDPLYHSRRERAFILTVNCLHPAATCFCTSMGTGPRVGSGFDLNLTELEDLFLVEIGSELGRNILSGVPCEAASAFLLNAASRSLERASDEIARQLDTTDLPDLMINNLENAHWHEIGNRCLSCGNCTQVCPTCFCWDATDKLELDASLASRERIWDSCFNPGYSAQAGGNARPTIHSRYRQWLTHKFGSWKQQFGSFGCVGCGRCITWCPAGIDITVEVNALREVKA